jgi:hypothetical protein
MFVKMKDRLPTMDKYAIHRRWLVKCFLQQGTIEPYTKDLLTG